MLVDRFLDLLIGGDRNLHIGFRFALDLIQSMDVERIRHGYGQSGSNLKERDESMAPGQFLRNQVDHFFINHISIQIHKGEIGVLRQDLEDPIFIRIFKTDEGLLQSLSCAFLLLKRLSQLVGGNHPQSNQMITKALFLLRHVRSYCRSSITSSADQELKGFIL